MVFLQIDAMLKPEKQMTHVLKVPFFPQTDNVFNPHGACNVTSIAMCLSYLGIRGDASFPQLEDQLYKMCQTLGLSRHNPEHLAQLVRYKGKKDNLKFNGKINDIKQAIDQGHPTVLHGYFTRTGHIVVCCGYRENEFICNDPYGSYLDNYSSDVINGKNVVYSEELIEELCMPDGNLWIHEISN